MLEDCGDGITACLIIHHRNGNKEQRGCAEGATSVGAALAELADQDKKCKIFAMPGDVMEVCYCNYDGCNENMADHSNKDIMTGLGKALKCSICNDFSDDIGVCVSLGSQFRG